MTQVEHWTHPPLHTTDLIFTLEAWGFFGLIGAFAGAGALLRALIQKVGGRFWKQALRIHSSAFWDTQAAILVSDWLTLSPGSLLVLATLLGWVGYKTTLGSLSWVLSQKTDLDLLPTSRSSKRPRSEG